MANKRNVTRRSHAEVVISELDEIAVKIGERILQNSEAAAQLIFLSRDDLAAPLKHEMTALNYARHIVDARIVAIKSGSIV